MIPVAAYCRVSTDKEDQVNSFESQQRYFTQYIQTRPDWALYAVYADEGITGTSTKKRDAFNRMIADARQGKFRLILTKEVSRFSRNILDTIAFTRELRSLGVGVLFLNDGIHTLDPDAELRLSIMGSIAQEESRRTSQRVKWGQTQQMRQGVVFGRSMLGYTVHNGCMTVEPKGAEIVRLIYHKYALEQKGTTAIARELREAGIRTLTGSEDWRPAQVLKILKNEKYMGDLVQKKTYTPDYLSHEKKRNHGEEDFVIIENHHEPIVDRSLWEAVQARIRQQNRQLDGGAGHSNRYLFSGKIQCSRCGRSFVPRKKQRKDGSVYRRWCCYTATNFGKAGCDIGKQLREDRALALLQKALDSISLDQDAIIRQIAVQTAAAICSSTLGRSKLEGELCRIRQKKEAALDAFCGQQITAQELAVLKERYDRQIDGLRRQLEAVPADGPDIGQLQERLRAICRGEIYSEVFYKTLLNRMTVFPDGSAEVRLNQVEECWTFEL